MSDPHLEGWLTWLHQNHGDAVRFAVLYGSRARGTARRHSDYDVLLGLKEETDVRFLDRLLIYNPSDWYKIEAKPMTPSDMQRLWQTLGRTMLDPLFEGTILFDDGTWHGWQERYQALIAAGALTREGTTWVWHQEKDSDLAWRLTYLER